MPTTDEIRKATEEVAWWDGMSHEDNRPGVLDAAVKITRAWLAEHPADDGERATREWLVSVGFAAHRNGVALDLALKHPAGPWLYCSCNASDITPDWYLDDGRLIGCPDLNTRGQVRRLAAALGTDLLHGEQSREGEPNA